MSLGAAFRLGSPSSPQKAGAFTLDCKSNIKSTWREINNLLGKTKKVLPDHFRDDDQLISNPVDISNSFNSYFTNIGVSLASNINPTHTLFSAYLHNPNSSSFFLPPTNPFEVMQIGRMLKNTSTYGSDGIVSSVVKAVISFISRPLAYIFNLSFLTGSVPSHLKVAKVIPIFKSGDQRSKRNYRPISILPFFSKILERLVYNRLSKFLTNFNLLSDDQFGFRSHHSTDMAIIQLVDKLTDAACNKMSTVGVFIDLSKASDTVDHSILLTKLDYYGIRGVALQWFSSYLSDRQQFTTVNNVDSDRRSILCGVPQGSILGPLLFLLYLNDLHFSSSMLQFILFADDTTITYSHPNLVTLVHTLNMELDKVTTWFKANKLSLNHSKANFKVFTSSTRPLGDLNTIRIDNIVISRVHSTKFLGVIIDDKLTWSDHITTITKTVSRNTGILAKLRVFIPLSTLFSLYNTLILPHLTYCNIVWAHTSNSKLHSLFVVQKRAIRICTSAHPRDHTAPLFARLNTLTLSDINKLHTAIFMFKFTHNLLPRSFSSYFTSVRNTHTYSTRSRNNLFLPFTRTSFSINNLRYYGPRLWNSIDEQLKTQSCVGRFKSTYKRVLISHYVT